jgi:hypothetical protein
MLVYGTANPVGYGGNDYEGLYLTDGDLDKITPTIVGTPVKIEHKVCSLSLSLPFPTPHGHTPSVPERGLRRGAGG